MVKIKSHQQVTDLEMTQMLELASREFQIIPAMQRWEGFYFEISSGK
jgi:hypothetical protein